MKRRRTLVACGAACAVLLVLAACGSSDTADPGALTGAEWTLTESSMSSIDLGAAGITATFDGERIAGFSGVNQYGGPYSAGDDGSLEVGDLASTLMAGPERLMRAEQAYLALLSQCTSYRVENDILTLSTGASETLVYAKVAAAQLSGTAWTVTSYNNGKQAVVSLIPGSQLTIAFGTDGTVTGNGGVNAFHGPCETTGATVKIGPLAATMKAGSADLAAQETRFLAALESSATWSIVQGRLEMRDADDALQIIADPQK